MLEMPAPRAYLQKERTLDAQKSLMRDFAKLTKIVEDTIAEEFGNVRFLGVKVVLGHDADGDEILRIKLLYDGAPDDLDIKKVGSLVRILRPKLLGLAGESAFPVISYISNADNGMDYFAAA
jgi:hypothetical protein